jgi:putative copper export protein
VGGQIVLGVLVPTLRSSFPEAPKVVARSFARVAWPAFAVLVVTGLWNLGDIDVANTTTAYQITLFVKILFAMASGAAAVVHQVGQSRAALAIGGAVGLLAALGAMYCGFLLSTGT